MVENLFPKIGPSAKEQVGDFIAHSIIDIIAFRLEGRYNLKYLKILAKNPFYHFIKIKLGSCINWVCNYTAPK